MTRLCDKRADCARNGATLSQDLAVPRQIARFTPMSEDLSPDESISSQTNPSAQKSANRLANELIASADEATSRQMSRYRGRSGGGTTALAVSRPLVSGRSLPL